ncbi:MAG: M23 family metallopeptidase [Porphyromonas sp.]|nr:M23 family metallopeptidase [Porphyromonas sp.]
MRHLNYRCILAAVTWISLHGLVSAQAPPGGKNNQEPVKAIEAAIQKQMGKDSLIVADNLKVKDVRRTKELNKAIEESIAIELEREKLDFPAIDVYGENSWHSKSVNPLIGDAIVAIPDTYDIDCTQFTSPLDNETLRVTSRYGYRKRYRRMHYGIDLGLKIGDSVRVAFDGKVRMVNYERKGYGHYVVVRHPNGLETVYGHLSRAIVTEDQVVKAGDVIALGGNTGRSSGPHLHFETRFMGIPINPELIIDFSTGVPHNDVYTFVRGRHRETGATLASSRRSSASSTSKNIVVHRVKSGDTLSAIASRYGTSVNKICKLNGITPKTTLKIGRALRITA